MMIVKMRFPADTTPEASPMRVLTTGITASANRKNGNASM